MRLHRNAKIRYSSLPILFGGINLTLLLALLFIFVSHAQADGPIVDLSQNEQDVIILGDNPDHGWLGEITGSSDFNGDGFDDLLVSASGNNHNGTNSGAAYMILGDENLDSSFDLTTTSPNLTVYGANAGDALGHSVAGGDVNGDGYDDMIIGADTYNGNQGAVYVVMGHDDSFFSTPIMMDLAITAPELTILGEFSGGRFGRSVASADINNDNFDDIVVGSYYAEPGGRTQAGAVYVILGSSTLITSTAQVTLELSSQSPALTIYGDDDNDRMARTVATGDVNGDGIADIIAGAYWADVNANNEGEIYVFYGSESYTSTLPSTIDLGAGSTADITFTGIDPGDESGFYVGSGDLNNDSYADIMIGAYQSLGWNNADDPETGEVYVIYGADNLSGSLSLATASDVIVYGIDSGDVGSGDRLGRAVSAGDVNADGYEDMILGSSWANPGDPGRVNAGQVYVIYGGENISTTILLSDTASSNIQILGDDGYDGSGSCNPYVDDCGDEAGRAVSVGDINGDEVTDIVVGSVFANNGTIIDAGAAYVVYGSKAMSIELMPVTNTVIAGQSITYTLIASNTFGTWEISELGNYTIDPAAGGSWTDNVYSGGISGTWTVTATFQSLTDTAVLTIGHSPAATLDISPNPETIMAGEAVTYTATASDAYGNSWDVTNTTTFTITDGAGGSWTGGNVYTSENAATWTVTGTYQSVVGTASLTVEPVELAFSNSTYEVSEDSGQAVITVTVSPAPLTQVTVDYDTSNGSAVAGSDYQTASGMLTFSPGTTELTFTVSITDDLVDENNEDLNLTLSNPSGAASISDGTAVLSITDNDAAGVTLSTSSVVATEGDITGTYTVQLNTVPTATVTVNFNTGSQIEAISSLTFAADITALDPQTVTVTADDDTVVEGDHSGVISHSASGGGYNGVSIADVSVAITDNDIGYTLAASNASITEGDTGSSSISFTITRTGDITHTSMVDFTLGGTATYGVDYNTVSPTLGIINFDEEEVSRTIDIDVLGDYENESNETITVTLSSPSGTNSSGTGSVSGSPATTTIIDDDAPGVEITESGGSTNVTEDGATDSYQVVLNTQPTDPVTVTITSDTQVGLSPTSLVFTTGNWDSARTVTVTADDDDVYEGNHTALITHTATSNDSDYDGITIDDVTANITDNDSLPTLTISDVTVNEGIGTATITATLSGESTFPVSVNYTISGGTATGGGTDYSATNGTFNWSSGQTGSRTAPVDINDDGNDEPAETVNLTLSNPISATIVDGTGVLTIIDNDVPAVPVLITPTNGITTITKPTFVWEDGGGSQTGVISYTLVYTGSSQPATTVTTVQPIYTPTTNLNTGVYTWTVRAHDVEGNAGNYASPAYFRIDPAAGGNTMIYLPLIIRN